MPTKPGDQHSSRHRWQHLPPLNPWLPDADRQLPDTEAWEEKFWHAVECACVACFKDDDARRLKFWRIRAGLPVVKHGSQPLPELPYRPEHLLRGV